MLFLSRLPVISLLFLIAPVAWGDSEFRVGSAPRVVAVADVHGGYEELASILRETGIIDAQARWNGGQTRLVSTGDLLDRGPASRKVLDLMMRLETEARQAGGAVHVLLGNHEVMNLVGDLRYVSPEEYGEFAGPEDAALREQAWQRVRERQPDAGRADFDTQFAPGYFAHRQAFAPAGRYGAWLMAKPFLIVVNDSAFVHGGLPPLVAELGLEATNERLHTQLSDYLRTWSAVTEQLGIVRPIEFLERPSALEQAGAVEQARTVREMQELPLFQDAGPSWYRRQALCYPFTESDNLSAALKKLSASRVVVGHTVSPTRRVVSRFYGQVIQLDTGMLRSAYQGTPSAFVFERGQWTTAYADRPGQRLPAQAPPRAVGPRPEGLDDDALEQWLKDAEVVQIEDLDTGVTQPHRVTLRKDGLQMRAVFKELSVDSGATGQQRPVNVSDKFQYEIAAYKLDRMIGLDMVPVTVERTVGRKRGIVQFWVEKSINVRRMLEQKKRPAGLCPIDPQYNLMNVFDILTHNTDRTQENALFTEDWMLVLIDHSRAFRTFTKNPRLLAKTPVTVPAALAERLRLLNEANLKQTLGAYLKGEQIDGMLRRRDRLLKEYAPR
jgi:hypothetical protein